MHIIRICKILIAQKARNVYWHLTVLWSVPALFKFGKIYTSEKTCYWYFFTGATYFIQYMIDIKIDIKMFSVWTFKSVHNQRPNKQNIATLHFTVSFNLLGVIQLSSATSDIFPLFLVHCWWVITSAQILFLFDLKPIAYILLDKNGPDMTSVL